MTSNDQASTGTSAMSLSADTQAILTQLPAIMHGVDKEGRLLFVSEKWQATMGYSAEAVRGRHITDFMDDETRDWVMRETLPRFFRDGIVEDVLITMITASGEHRSLVLSSQAQFDENGAFLHSLSILIDITERMTNAEALAQSERRFRGSFQTAPYGMALVAPDGGWIEVNDRICDIVGYSKSELLRTDFQTITYPEDLESDLHLLHELLDDKIKSYQLEKRYIHKNGSIVPCMLSVSLVRDSHGAPVHFVSQIQDLSEQKLVEARLLRAQKLEAVGQLTGGMAHDFNNLLTVAVGSLQLLEHKVGDDMVARQRWEAAMSACEKGAELTRRMLAFARRQSLAPETLSPGELVSGMEELLRRTLGGNIDLVSEIGPDVPDVNVDRSQMESALLNLALNARDAMPKGGRLSIKVEAARLEGTDDGAPGGDGVRISVSDTGTGIPPEVLTKVFEPFFTTKGTEGSGMGLSMVYGFMTQSGGHVKVRSAANQGTSVDMYLPRAAAIMRHGPADTEDTDRRAGGGGETILVAEDQPEVRDLAVTMLEQLGYRVIFVGDAAAALERIKADDSIDLLFTDIVMPGPLNGFDLAKQARALRPQLRVVTTTGYASKALVDEVSGDEARRPPVLPKPYRLNSLARIIRWTLESPPGITGNGWLMESRKSR